MSLNILEGKWYDKTVAALKDHWVPTFRSARTFDGFVSGISKVTGIAPATIRRSLPARNFRSAQAKASQYLQVMLKNLASAHKTKSWATGYRAAFGGAQGPVRRIIRRRKRKGGASTKVRVTKPRKTRRSRKAGGSRKASTKTSSKKRGKRSNKTTYGTKSEAKAHRPKGGSVYKVKGGYHVGRKPRK